MLLGGGPRLDGDLRVAFTGLLAPNVGTEAVSVGALTHAMRRANGGRLPGALPQGAAAGFDEIAAVAEARGGDSRRIYQVVRNQIRSPCPTATR